MDLAVFITVLLFYCAFNLWAFEVGPANVPPRWIDNADMWMITLSAVIAPGYWVGRWCRRRKLLKKPRW